MGTVGTPSQYNCTVSLEEWGVFLEGWFGGEFTCTIARRVLSVPYVYSYTREPLVLGCVRSYLETTQISTDTICAITDRGFDHQSTVTPVVGGSTPHTTGNFRSDYSTELSSVDVQYCFYDSLPPPKSAWLEEKITCESD